MSLRGYCLEKEDEKPPRSIDECLLIMSSEVGSGMIRFDVILPLNKGNISEFCFFLLVLHCFLFFFSQTLNHSDSQAGVKSLTDQEIVQMVEKKHVPGYKLETVLGDPLRAVAIRRSVIAPHTASQNALETLPFDHYDYTKVKGMVVPFYVVLLAFCSDFETHQSLLFAFMKKKNYRL